MDEVKKIMIAIEEASEKMQDATTGNKALENEISECYNEKYETLERFCGHMADGCAYAPEQIDEAKDIRSRLTDVLLKAMGSRLRNVTAWAPHLLRGQMSASEHGTFDTFCLEWLAGCQELLLIFSKSPVLQKALKSTTFLALNLETLQSKSEPHERLREWSHLWVLADRRTRAAMSSAGTPGDDHACVTLPSEYTTLLRELVSAVGFLDIAAPIEEFVRVQLNKCPPGEGSVESNSFAVVAKELKEKLPENCKQTVENFFARARVLDVEQNLKAGHTIGFLDLTRVLNSATSISHGMRNESLEQATSNIKKEWEIDAKDFIADGGFKEAKLFVEKYQRLDFDGAVENWKFRNELDYLHSKDDDQERTDEAVTITNFGQNCAKRFDAIDLFVVSKEQIANYAPPDVKEGIERVVAAKVDIERVSLAAAKTMSTILAVRALLLSEPAKQRASLTKSLEYAKLALEVPVTKLATTLQKRIAAVLSSEASVAAEAAPIAAEASSPKKKAKLRLRRQSSAA